MTVLNFPNNAQTGPIFPADSRSTAPAQTAANLNTLVRYINITAAPGSCLFFRELYAFDASMTNVALYKPTTHGAGGYALPLYNDPVYYFTSYASYGVDGIIDMDNPIGNMVNLPCDGTGWWQVDLGGVYNLQRLVFWNNFPYVAGNTAAGAAIGANANGAIVTYLNGNGNPIGTYTLTGDVIQSFAVVTFPSPTPSKSPKATVTPTGSLTVGAAPSSTPTLTPSVSSSSTVAPLAAPPSASPSPFAPYPFKITVSLTTPNYLNFVELFAFTSTGQNVAASVLGSTAAFTPGDYSVVAGSAWTGGGASQAAWYATDLFADPMRAWTLNQPAGAIAGTATSGAFTWAVNFPPAPGYPNGLPQPISSVVFVNRCDQVNLNLNGRINGGVLQLVGPNSTVLSSGVFNSLSVQTFNFANWAQTAPIYPDSSLTTAPPQTTANLNTLIRYINITAGPGICLAFRELYAFDNTITNVALYKAASQSNTSFNGGYYDPSGFLSLPSYGTDGVIDMDNLASGNMVNVGCNGFKWWAVDLGGVYNLTKIIFFNRFPLTNPSTTGQALGAKIAGATMTYLNGFGNPLTSYVITGDMIQSIPIVQVPGSYQVSLSTVGTGNILNFVELFAFTSTGQNVAATALGATSVWSAGTQYPGPPNPLLNTYGNDLVTDPYLAYNGGNSPQQITGSSAGATWLLTFPVMDAVEYPFGQPAQISSVVVINRIDQPSANVYTRINGANVTLMAANYTVQSTATLTVTSTYATALTATFPNNAQTAAIFPNSSLSTAPAQTAANLNSLVRYINITSAPGACLSFRELYVFDNTYTNVAFFKPTSQGSGGITLSFYNDPVYYFTSFSSYGVDGVIDMDNSAGNMVNLPCDGSGWWQVDLGGVYNLKRLIFWNRYPFIAGNTALGTALGANAAGATVTYLNGFGNFVGSYTLTGDVIQSIPVVLVPASSTSSVTASPSSTPSTTPAVTASETVGAMPSDTSSPSLSASPSPTSSVTVPLPPPSPSPFAPYPYKVQIGLPPTLPNYLNFVEIFAFTPSGQDVAAAFLGSSATFLDGTNTAQPWTGGGATQWPWYATDLFADPMVAWTLNQPAGAIAGTQTPGAFALTVTFPPAPGYPNGLPQPISSVVFVNRCDQVTLNLNGRINGGFLNLVAANNTILSTRTMSSLSVQTFTFPNWPSAAPVYPSSSLSTAPPQTAANQDVFIRYINITAGPGICLAFRELYALDHTITNVALNKPASQSNTSFNGGYYDPSGFLSLPSYGTDGVIDMDNLTSGNMVNVGCNGFKWWAVDLGGVYNVTKIIFFNRFPLTNPSTTGQALGAKIAGATMTYLNGNGNYVNSYIITGNMIQSIDVDQTAGAYQVALSTNVAGAGGILNFVELFAFTSTGQNVAAAALGATSVWSTGTQYAGPPNAALNTYANDLFTDPYLAFNNNAAPMKIAATSSAGTWLVTFPVTNSLLYPFGEPSPIASVVIINRVDQPALNLYQRINGAAVTLYAANFSVLSTATLTTSLTSATAFTVNFPNYAQAGPIYPNSSLAQQSVTALQASPINQATYVRYIQIAAAPSQCLYFRELYAFDNTWTNVAFFKPTTQGSGASTLASYTDPLQGFTSYASYGTDGIIDMDNPAGNMVNLPCDGSAWWQVDLGGVYNLQRIIFWNRYPYNASGAPSVYASQANGAQMIFLNGNGVNVGVTTLTGDAIQSIPVVLTRATPSFTGTAATTPSQTGTGTITTSPSSTPSASATPTSSLSNGASPSATAAPSVASNSPSMSSAPTPPAVAASASAAPTPLSPLSASVVVSTNGGLTAGRGAWGCLQFFETFVFSPTWTLLSAPAGVAASRGASATMTTTSQSLFSTYGAQLGNNLYVDLTGETGLVHSGCSTAGDVWTLALGAPSVVGAIYFVNRGTANGPNNVAITNGSGVVTVKSQQGVSIATAVLTSATVTTVTNGMGPFTWGSAAVRATGWNAYGDAGPTAAAYNTPGFATPASSPSYPDPSDPWQASLQAQTFAVRYVTVVAPLFLNFRELFILDSNMVNVAFLKNASLVSTAMFSNDPVPYTPSMGCDGIIDFDANYGNMVFAGPQRIPTWTVDLGGVYNVSYFIFFNRVSSGLGGGYAANSAGATISFYNAFGALVGSNTLVGNPIETQPVVLFAPSNSPTQTPSSGATHTPSHTSAPTSPVATVTPSMTPSSSPSASTTPSQSATPSASLSNGASPSVSTSLTSTPTATASLSSTPSATVTPSASATQTGTPAPLLNVAPVAVRVAGPIGVSSCLNFMEVLAFDVSNRLVSALQTGASTVSSSSPYCANAGTPSQFCNYAYYGNDMLADPYSLDYPNQLFYNSQCSGAASISNWWQVTFAYANPGSPFYPYPIPAPISNVYFVNRNYNGFYTRTTGSFVQLMLNNGSVLAQQPLTTKTVTTLTFATPVPAATPNPLLSVQQDPYAQLVTTRFVRINAAAGKCLTFRE